MHDHNHPKICCAGFTLVEMTVSLMLLSFITIIGYQALMFGLQQWQQGNDKMTFQYNYFQAVSWVRNKLGSSEKVKDLNSNANAYLFNGSSESVEFVARYSRTRRGGLYVNKIQFNEQDQTITVNYYLHHPDNQSTINPAGLQGVSLLTQVESLRFFYFGNKQGEKATWHDNWSNSTTLPQLVRMEIHNDSGQRYESTIHVSTSNNS